VSRFIATILIFTVSFFLSNCSGDDDKKSSSNSSTNSIFNVTVASTLVTTGTSELGSLAQKQINYIMAVDPSAGNSSRYVAAVDSDEVFSLSISSGSPYVIVFIAQDGTPWGTFNHAVLEKV
jgi:hypothetical protein